MELYCVVVVVPENPAGGEMTVADAAVVDPSAEPDDELLFLFASAEDEELVAEHVFDGFCDVLGISNDEIQQFVDSFEDR